MAGSAKHTNSVSTVGMRKGILKLFFDKLLVQCMRQGLEILAKKDPVKYGSAFRIPSSAPIVAHNNSALGRDSMEEHEDEDRFDTAMPQENPLLVGLPSEQSLRVQTTVGVTPDRALDEETWSTLEYFSQLGRKMSHKLYGTEQHPFQIEGMESTHS